MDIFSLTRRSLFGLIAVGALAGCASTPELPRASSSSPRPIPTPSASPKRIDCDPAFLALEAQFAARLGVWAIDTGSGAQIGYREAERFAFCSTGKAFLAALTLRTHSTAELAAVVHYGPGDLPPHSPITTLNLATGMTLAQLCDAAVRFSDNGAANLLYSRIGGPKALESFLRGIGDEVTSMDRREPDLNFAVPGDSRDTTTPQAWAEDFRQLVLGKVLDADQRAIVVDWLERNTTGATLIRSAVPASWKVADKTGSGWYGTRNDLAVVWPPGREPIVLALMSSRTEQGATIDDALLAQAAAAVIRAFD